jgi:hypothetical protein
MYYRSIASCCVVLAACGDNGIVVPTLDDITISAAEDTPLVITVPLIAAEPAEVKMTVVTPPSHGTIIGLGPSYTYTPAAEYSGDDAMVVKAEDVRGTSMATVTIHVAAVDDAPVANSDCLKTDFGTQLTIPVSRLLINDTDIDSTTLTVTAVTAVAHCTVVLNGTDIVFTPEASYSGPAVFSYTLSDGTRTTLGTVTVTVGFDNPPVAVDDIAIILEDTPLVIPDAALLANDSDVDLQTLTVTAVGSATHGTIAHAGTTTTFTPAANYNGPASFAYTISDGFKTATATVAVTVLSVNDPPVANADSTETTEDTPVSFLAGDLTTNDTDVDGDSLLVTAVTATDDTNGTVSLSGGIVTYTPASNFNGDASFTYTVFDGSATVTGTVTITVAAVDDAPVAVADTSTVVEDSAANPINVLANDTDIDGGPITVASVTTPVHGTAAVINNGTAVSYTPAANYCNHVIPPGIAGPLGGQITPNASLFDQFTYTLTPGGSTATVTVTVSCVDDPPVANNDTATVNEDSSNNLINVLANDTDIDGGTDTIASVTDPGNGAAAIGPSSLSVSYTPDTDYCNNIPNAPRDTFTYTLTPGTSTATVGITVVCQCGQLRPTDFFVGAAP